MAWHCPWVHSEVHQLLRCAQFSQNKRTWFMCICSAFCFGLQYSFYLWYSLLPSTVSLSLLPHMHIQAVWWFESWNYDASRIYVNQITSSIHFHSPCYGFRHIWNIFSYINSLPSHNDPMRCHCFLSFTVDETVNSVHKYSSIFPRLKLVME